MSTFPTGRGRGPKVRKIIDQKKKSLYLHYILLIYIEIFSTKMPFDHFSHAPYSLNYYIIINFKKINKLNFFFFFQKLFRESPEVYILFFNNSDSYHTFLSIPFVHLSFCPLSMFLLSLPLFLLSSSNLLSPSLSLFPPERPN